MIEYTIVKKEILSTVQTKFFPKIVRAKTAEMEEIISLLQERTTLEESEVVSFLMAFSKAIRHYVTNSYVVEVEGLGIFTPSISAKSVSTSDQITAHTITKKGVNYRPTKDMDYDLQQIKFRKANLDTLHL